MLRYAITDRRLGGEDEGSRRAWVIAQAARLAGTGVEFLQVREKDMSPRELAGLVREVMEVIEACAPRRGQRMRVLVNGRVDAAIAAGADGVHLTSAAGELTPAQVRSVYASAGLAAPVVSVSCHSATEVARAVEGAGNNLPDLILFGPVFEKAVPGKGSLAGPRKRGREGVGLNRLQEACIAAGSARVLALGGVTDANAASCIAAGAAGIAAIRLFRER